MINRARKLRRDVQILLREDYLESKERIRIIPERIATERARLTSIRSATSDAGTVHTEENSRQERDTAAIVTIDKLEADLDVAKREIKVIDGILSQLDPRERRCVELMDLSRQKGAVERLSEEFGYDRSVVYDIYNCALDKIARLYWGK